MKRKKTGMIKKEKTDTNKPKRQIANKQTGEKQKHITTATKKVQINNIKTNKITNKPLFIHCLVLPKQARNDTQVEK